MRWSDIRFNPGRNELRQFAGLCLLIFGALAAWRATRGEVAVAVVFAVLSLGVGLVGLLRPAAIRWVYVGWMVVAFPIGWVVSKLIIALMFYGIITPLALWFRMRGRDVLRRGRPGAASSFWRPKAAPGDVGRYFRQY